MDSSPALDLESLDKETFFDLPTTQVSSILSQLNESDSTCVFAYDGTRRWFMTECLYQNHSDEDSSVIYDEQPVLQGRWEDYCKVAMRPFLETIVPMIFEHGVQNVVYPMWFPTLGKRGSSYLPKFIQYMQGLNDLLFDEELATRYKDLDVRVIFYGDFQGLVGGQEGGEEFLALMNRIMDESSSRSTHYLLLGCRLGHPAEIVSNLVQSFVTEHGIRPTRDDLIQKYFGIKIRDISFYIGFEKLSTEGTPILLSDGSEDLYFTVSPHGYFNQRQLREILYDHFFCRSVANTSEYFITYRDIHLMREFYRNNDHQSVGVGAVQPKGRYWYPSHQIHSQKESTTVTRPTNPPTPSLFSPSTPSRKSNSKYRLFSLATFFGSKQHKSSGTSNVSDEGAGLQSPQLAGRDSSTNSSYATASASPKEDHTRKKKSGMKSRFLASLR